MIDQPDVLAQLIADFAVRRTTNTPGRRPEAVD
ncbi:MAG: hypothetical protein JWR37_4659 [Mycobacterium sp.]|jgi:hypothetical protein|nr:hypothetical protein [Mycobacterium sp.]